MPSRMGATVTNPENVELQTEPLAYLNNGQSWQLFAAKISVDYGRPPVRFQGELLPESWAAQGRQDASAGEG